MQGLNHSSSFNWHDVYGTGKEASNTNSNLFRWIASLRKVSIMNQNHTSTNNLPLGPELYRRAWQKAEKTGTLLLYPESGYDLQDAGSLKINWIVENLIAEETLTTISALPGSFKTWLYQYLAVKVAKGESAFGQYKTHKSSVLIVNEESSKSFLHRNLKQLGWTPDLPIFSLNLVGYKMHQLFVDAIIQTAKDLDAKFVIFDSFVRFNNKDENDSGEMAEIMDYYRQIAKAGLGVLIIHHNRKGMVGYSNAALDMRGSIELLAAVDSHYALQRKSLTSEYVKLVPTKNRLLGKVKTVELRFADGASEFELIGSDKTDTEKHAEILDKILLIVRQNPEASQSELIDIVEASDIKAGNKAVVSLLKELEMAKRIECRTGNQRNTYQYFAV